MVDLSGSIPTIPSVPALPAVPALPSIPSLPAVPALPAMPTLNIPAVPALPALPSIPSIPDLPTAAAAKDLIAIEIPKPFKRDEFPGRPGVDQIQHTIIQQGQMVERSIGDAMYNISEAKKQVTQRVEHYMNMNKLANSVQGDIGAAQIGAPQIAAAVQDNVAKIRSYIADTMALVKAMQGVLGQLQTVKSRIQGYLQSKLNSIATFINQICNFSLPDLPAIPNIFGNLHFDGFQFPSGAFKFALNFDVNFAFGACKLRKPNLDVFRNFPKAKIGLGASGTIGTQPTLNPPLPNSRMATATTPPEALRTIKNIPIFREDFYPDPAIFQGALPKPNQIVSAYEMPIDVFKEQAVSLIPGSPIADLQNPVLDSSLDVDYHRESLQPAVRAFARLNVTLEAIVDSNWDWKIVWLWLWQMSRYRTARGGVWISAFDEAYKTYVLPAYLDSQLNPIPWHTDPETPDEDASIVQGPATELMFTAELKALLPGQLTRVLWMLSYVEASLLGNQRSTRWDAAAPLDTTHYTTGATRDDLDYQELNEVATGAPKVFVLDSQGRANYPSSIEVPDYLVPGMTPVIAWAFADILAVDTYTAPRISNRYTYGPRADLTEVNSHSQFWKEFKNNWADLAEEDIHLQAIVCNYPKVLNSFLNPLASRALFDFVKSDFTNRSKTWTPGTPILPTPYIPTMILPPMQLMLGEGEANGWGGVNDGTADNVDADGRPVPLVFDPVTFLNRADVKALSPNYQDTLLYLNESYQNLLGIQETQMMVLDEAIAFAEAQIAEGLAQIAAMEALAPDYRIPPGHPGL